MKSNSNVLSQVRCTNLPVLGKLTEMLRVLMLNILSYFSKSKHVIMKFFINPFAKWTSLIKEASFSSGNGIYLRKFYKKVQCFLTIFKKIYLKWCKLDSARWKETNRWFQLATQDCTYNCMERSNVGKQMLILK